MDVTDLGIGDSMHVRDLAANAAWTPISDPDMMLVHVVSHQGRRGSRAGGRRRRRGGGGGGCGDGGAAEPEVIKKGKTDKEGDAKADKKKDDKKQTSGSD